MLKNVIVYWAFCQRSPWSWCFGVVYAMGLQLIGLEVGLIIGMVAGLCSIIPYLGFAVGIIAAVIASLFQFGIDWMQLPLVGGSL